MPLLLAVTTVLVAIFHAVGLPAAFLLGAMGAAMLVAGRGTSLKLPRSLFTLAQAVVGCLIARNFTPALAHTVGHHITLFVGVVATVLLLATALGMALTRLHVLPGNTALWGSFPGAATVMVLLSDSFGADLRLVALMQYLRVVVVAVLASLVGHFWGHPSTALHHPVWFAPVGFPSFAILITIVLIGGLVGPRLPIPAGPLLLSMVFTTFLQNVGNQRLELPQLLLAASYLVVGWAIGLRFTRDVFRTAAHALPGVLTSITALVTSCAAIGGVLTRFAHIDALTAYLATSPGGADSVAIIAAGTTADVPFVMAVQTGRFVAVLLLGPVLAKGAAKLIGAAPPVKRP